MFQYFTFIISLNHMHPHLASHAAFLFSFQVLLPTHKKQNVLLKIILIQYNVQIQHKYVMSFLKKINCNDYTSCLQYTK